MSATQKNKTHKLNEKIEGQEIRCYDNDSKTVDRFTVVFMNQRENGGFMALGMNHEPFHPQGFGQHTSAMAGLHLGKRIPFSSLPIDCRKLVISDCLAFSE